ncbi:MAG TPA: sigma-70 family RNA polymerase sigma factor [Candidatus Eremiobacteraceae bacterium]|jgi:RNA polymerase sigma-70 factor, ECF subfamily|nr:sigma-70 family RNA polymerase sigma factor [Candidatus Eremiobacteraceae bacterium]
MSTMYVRPAANTSDRIPHVVGNSDLRDESWLVARAKSGHDDAFGELYQRYQLKSYRTALRILRHQQDAEDIVQRAFQRAFVSLEAFREDSTFSTWLTRVVINEALMLLRQRRTREPLHEGSVDASKDDGGVEIADGGPTPEEILCENERHATLRQAIAKLRESLRVVVLHRDVEGLTSAETAQRLGLTVSAVKARTFHARRFLKKHLERKFKRASLINKLQSKKTAELSRSASLSAGFDR